MLLAHRAICAPEDGRPDAQRIFAAAAAIRAAATIDSLTAAAQLQPAPQPLRRRGRPPIMRSAA